MTNRNEAKQIIDDFHGVLVEKDDNGFKMVRERNAAGGVAFRVRGSRESLLEMSADARIEMAGLAIDDRPLAYATAIAYVKR